MRSLAGVSLSRIDEATDDELAAAVSTGSKAIAVNERARFKVPMPLRGQTDCWPDGAGLTCAGASGGTTYDFDVAPSGFTMLMSNAYSDGACPVGDCGTHAPELHFVLPPGATIVPDPLGSFAPAPASSSK